jgi:protein TonB
LKVFFDTKGTVKNWSRSLLVPLGSFFPSSMPESVRRSLLQACFLSLALHGALLLSIAYTLPMRLEMPVARLNAVLSSRVTASPVAKPMQNSTPKPTLKLAPTLRQPAVQVSETSTMRSLMLPDTVHQAVPDAVTHSTDDPHFASAKPSLVAVNLEAASSPGVSADDLRQYRLSLAISARRFKRYPPLARERGWEGTAEVALSFSALLPTPQISLPRSSGSPLLDEQALDMVAQAARLTVLPESLKGRDLHILLPVKFSLDEH